MRIEFYEKNTVPPLLVGKPKDLYANAKGEVVEIYIPHCDDCGDIGYSTRNDLYFKVVE
jgi:hypothetical protein